jgi:hypothetical protein
MAVMGNGYGSEWHLLRFLGRYREHLNREVQSVIGCDSITWLDSPFPSANGSDREWRQLDFLPLASDARRDWTVRWPQSGNVPNWDAVAQTQTRDQREWLLVEAKANAPELRQPCQASDKAGGLTRIRTVFDYTKHVLGVSPAADWLKPYYQYCNRIAILNHLLEHQVPARLLFIYFAGDVFPGGRECPGDAAAWGQMLMEMDRHIGVSSNNPIKSRIHRVFLPVTVITAG